MARFASALSEHPLTAHAVGEAAGQILDRLSGRPDLALVFVTPHHAGALEDAARTVETLLGPAVVLGCAAEGVVGTGREVEQGPGVSVWAGATGTVVPLELEATGPDGPILGWPDPPPDGPEVDPGLLLLLADPFSFPVEVAFAQIQERRPGLTVAGGMASGAQGPGGSRLVHSGRVRTTGAVGALLGRGAAAVPVVSQGCRPVGHPLVVTRAAGNMVYELAGRPPLDRLAELARTGLSEREVALINRGGLHLGRVIDEHRDTFGPGDFLVRNVLGGDRTAGAIAVNDVVETGTTVQFHVRDASAADGDLRGLLDSRQAEAALLFTCNGRGTRMFPSPHHDAGALVEAFGPLPTAGFFAAGEFGPVGGRNFLHGFTAVMALFGAAA